MCPTWFPLKPILHRTSLSLRQEDRASFLRRRVSCSKHLAEPSSLTVLSVCGGQDSSCSFRKSSTPTPPLLLGLLSQTFAPRPRGLLSPVLAGESCGQLCTQLTPTAGVELTSASPRTCLPFLAPGTPGTELAPSASCLAGRSRICGWCLPFGPNSKPHGSLCSSPCRLSSRLILSGPKTPKPLS